MTLPAICKELRRRKLKNASDIPFSIFLLRQILNDYMNDYKKTNRGELLIEKLFIENDLSLDFIYKIPVIVWWRYCENVLLIHDKFIIKKYTLFHVSM